jgi:hypothetical protein
MRKVRKTKTFGLRRKSKLAKFSFTEFEIAKLELNPGDMIVLRTDLILNKDQLQGLHYHATKLFPGIKVAVLSAGLSLAVISDKRGPRHDRHR